MAADRTAAVPPGGDPSPPGRHAMPPEPVRPLGIALVLISAAQLMIVLDGSVVNIALPRIQAELGITDANLTWVVTAYALSFGGLLLLGGRLGDVLGRRRVFISGVLIFAIGSMLGGISQAEWQLLAARALQGAGAAAASPTALALITTNFPAGPRRNRAFAVYAAMSGAGAAVGLILGGALTEVSWRWTMLINVPIGLLVAVLAPRFLTESKPQPGRWDLPGAVTATVGLVSLVYGFNHKGQIDPATRLPSTWTDPLVLGPITVGVVLIVAFFFLEARTPQPLLPLRVVTDRTRAVSFVVMLLVGAAIFAMFLFLSLFIQKVMGYSPLQSGVAFLPFTVGIITAAQAASALISRVDPRWIAGTGGVLEIAAFWGYSRLTVDATYVSGLLPWIILQSIGMGLMFVPLTLTAVSRVDPADAGVGSAVLNTVQQVGAAVGIAVLGTVYANGITARAAELAASRPPQDPGRAALLAQVHGTSQTFHVAAALMVAATLITLIGLNIRHQDLADDGTPGAAAPVPDLGSRAPAATLVPPPREAPDAARPASDAVHGTGGRHRAEP